MSATIKIKGMHCKNCENTITKAFAKKNITVEKISHRTGIAQLAQDDISTQEIAKVLAQQGYTIDTETIAKKKNMIERKVIIQGIITILLTTVLQGILLNTVYPRLSDMSSQYIIPLMTIPLIVVINVFALWHQRAYRNDVSCMTGMMIGMTIGMTSGLAIGYVSGLLNGMFFGSVLGLVIGMIVGAYAGACCGIMGIMEGMMAGLMGGTMGAMLAVMLIVDHPIAFLIILLLVVLAILGGLMRIVCNEHQGNPHNVKEWPISIVLGVTIALVIVLSVTMLLLPRGVY